MNKEQILSAVASLAKSQWFYGRLLCELRGNEKALDYLEQPNFGDTLDLVMFLEC